LLAGLIALARGGSNGAPVAGPISAAGWAGIAATAGFVAWIGWIAWSSGGAALDRDVAPADVASADAGDQPAGDGMNAERRPEAASSAADSKGGGVKLRVVAKESGEPLAGATVRFVVAPDDPHERVRVAWLDEARARDRFYDEHRFLDGDWYLDRQRELEATATRSGRNFVCNRDGEVVLPEFTLALVSVRKDPFATAAWIERGDASPLVFAVEREVGLRIAVVDRSGRPVAGVPVALNQTVAERGKRPWGFAIWRGTTKATDGIAEIAGGEIRELRTPANGQSWSGITVALGLADAASESVPIDLARLPSEPVRLTMAPTGRMHVRLTTAGGAPLLEPAAIGIGPDRRHPILEQRGVPFLWLSVSNGRIDVDGVGLDASFSIVLAVESDELCPTTTKVVGPTHENETVEVALAAGPPIGVVTGRLLLPDGEPLRAWPVRAKYDVALNVHQRLLETDEDGSFRLPLAVYFFEADGMPRFKCTRQLTLAPEHARELDPTLNALSIERTLEKAQLEPGVHDLGDLQLGAASVIVAGRVVDSDGRPRADVDVVVEQKRDGGLFMKNVIGDLHGRTKADGSFTIPGAPPPWPLRILARGDDCFRAEPIDFKCGARDLEIVVEKAGELRGTLLVDEGVPLDDVTIEPSREFIVDGAWFHDPIENVELAVDGRFRVARLRGARGSVTIALGRRSYGRPTYETLATIDDVVVKSGAICDDARIRTIDLRGKLRLLEFTVRDGDGAPISQANVKITPESGDPPQQPESGDPPLQSQRSLLTDTKGVARFAGLAATYRVEIAKNGFESVSLPDVPASREVVLHPER
jgi:hypothetical protein